MKIEVVRQKLTPFSAIGSLSVDGEFLCYTLEDTVREIPGVSVEKWKVQDHTAIPRGTYTLTTSFSARFKQNLPLLLGVPGYTGVRIHSGNTPEHTEGCILVGMTKSTDFVGDSRKAFKLLFDKIKKVVDKEKITITIR